MSDLTIEVRDQGPGDFSAHWAEVVIGFRTVDGPDSQRIYLPIEDAKRLQSAQTDSDRYKESLEQILETLGTGKCPANNCAGCADDTQEAISIARHALLGSTSPTPIP